MASAPRQAKGIVELSRGNYASACPPQTPPAARPRPWCSQLNIGQFDDFFSFSVLPAAAERYARVETIDSSPTNGAGNLAADIRLYVQDPQFGRWSDITSQAAARPIGLGMELTTQMPQASVYAVSVSSRGGYSDVGQYTVTVRERRGRGQVGTASAAGNNKLGGLGGAGSGGDLNLAGGDGNAAVNTGARMIFG